MKWVQITNLELTHEFELEGDESTTIRVVGDLGKVKMKLRKIFGKDIEIETFEE